MSGPEKIYLDKLAQGTFEIQRCGGCDKHVFYPRVPCPKQCDNYRGATGDRQESL